jgi:DNA (cytosine-5)-methyltransferase 1
MSEGLEELTALVKVVMSYRPDTKAAKRPRIEAIAPPKLTAIDLFCGAGGLSEGFRQAGFHVLVGQDYDAAAGRTFGATHPEATFIGGRIQDVTPAQILKDAGKRRGEIDVIVGGPPCQGYSVYNHQRGESDPRAGLFREYLRIVEGIYPRWLVMENVTGITSIAGGGVVREIYAGMESLGYRVDMRVLKAEEYGVPQERRRVVFIATRGDAPILFPEPTHGPGLAPFVTVWDAISDLPKIENGAKAGVLAYATEPRNDYQRTLRGNAVAVTNHSAPRLAKINEQRMLHIPPGGSWRDIPFELLPAGMKKAKRSDHTKRYGRPRKTDLACTILTKCDVHWGAYIHPVQNRALTVREAARLQSFPDSFAFQGSGTEQYVQVGNAVPPLLGRRVAEALLIADSKAEASHKSSRAGERLEMVVAV